MATKTKFPTDQIKQQNDQNNMTKTRIAKPRISNFVIKNFDRFIKKDVFVYKKWQKNVNSVFGISLEGKLEQIELKPSKLSQVVKDNFIK